MGYRGRIEYLCAVGHYHVETEVYGERRDVCVVCDAPMEWFNIIDDTNCDGVAAQRVEVGFTDRWHEDHYGNKYAEKHLTFKPEERRWLKIVEW